MPQNIIVKDMAGTLQVYVRGEQKLAAENVLVYVETGHPCSGTKSVTKLKKEAILPESNRQVISIARKLAEEKGMKLQIYDVSSKEGRLRALLAGVNETPIIIVRNQRITENITEEKLLSVLEQTHSE